MPAMRAANAASEWGVECLLWAVLDRALGVGDRECRAASEVGREPRLTDAAGRTKGSFGLCD